MVDILTDSPEILPPAKRDFRTALDVGAAIGGIVRYADGSEAVIVPKDWKLESLEPFRPRPSRKRGTIHFQEAASFTTYIGLHKQGGTIIFCDVEEYRFACIFDHHKPVPEFGEAGRDDAGWGEHVARYDCPLSDDWKRWARNDRQPKGQTDFAEFLEDNLPNIAQPDGAVLLEACKSLSSHATVKFQSAVNLTDGRIQFEYREEGAAGPGPKGQIAWPEKIKLALQVFVGGKIVYIDARMRYRIRDGGLMLFYILDRPDDVADAEFRSVIEDVNKTSGLTSLAGMPAEPEDEE